MIWNNPVISINQSISLTTPKVLLLLLFRRSSALSSSPLLHPFSLSSSPCIINNSHPVISSHPVLILLSFVDCSFSPSICRFSTYSLELCTEFFPVCRSSSSSVHHRQLPTLLNPAYLPNLPYLPNIIPCAFRLLDFEFPLP